MHHACMSLHYGKYLKANVWLWQTGRYRYKVPSFFFKKKSTIFAIKNLSNIQTRKRTLKRKREHKRKLNRASLALTNHIKEKVSTSGLD